MPPKHVYFLEGNISSGKSTLVEQLRDSEIAVFDEPVNEWTQRYVEVDGENILQKFYDDMTRWSFQFEVAIMTTRFKRLITALNSESDIVLLERSLWTDRKCFAHNLKEQGHMTEMEWIIYEDWFNTFMDATRHVLEGHHVTYIHLHTRSEECHRRMKVRARSEESSVPLEYLRLLEKKHLDWLEGGWPYRVITIDGHQSVAEIVGRVRKLILKSSSLAGSGQP